MTDLERFLYWLVYAAALEARKQRRNRKLADSLTWRRDVTQAAAQLGAMGMVL